MEWIQHMRSIHIQEFRMIVDQQREKQSILEKAVARITDEDDDDENNFESGQSSQPKISTQINSQKIDQLHDELVILAEKLKNSEIQTGEYLEKVQAIAAELTRLEQD